MEGGEGGREGGRGEGGGGGGGSIGGRRGRKDGGALTALQSLISETCFSFQSIFSYQRQPTAHGWR